MGPSLLPPAGESLEHVVQVATGAPETLVGAVVRIMKSDIFPEGLSRQSDPALSAGAKAAWAQLRRESSAFGAWDYRRRAFSLSSDAYDRLILESLRGNEAGVATALHTLHELESILRSCEILHRRGIFQEAAA